MSQIGFVILSHDRPTRVLRLTRRLAHSFPRCAIVCHHDLWRCPMNRAVFPKEVTFVLPSLKTFWGHISLVQAELRALRSLYDRHDPAWFCLLSGADYPIATAAQILADLGSERYDLYMDHRLITRPETPYTLRPARHCDPQWSVLAYHRYCATQLSDIAHNILSNVDAWSPGEIDKALDATRASCLTTSTRSFPGGFECFAGDHWIIGNRRAAMLLLAPSKLNDDCLRYFSGCAIPDEAIYQTILCNASGLRISPSNKRYADWSTLSDHPRFLGVSDIGRMLASGCYFARKFTEDATILDDIDAYLSSQ
jgi:hypothetical protein